MVIGDSEGHVGLGIKTSKEVATAIRAAIIIAKLSVLPIRRGYWGTNLGEPHSLPTKESGKCGSVTVRVCLLSQDARDSTAHSKQILMVCLVDSRSPRHWVGCLTRRQTSPPACWCTGRLHFIFWFNQNFGEHSQSHVHRCRQHVWFLDSQLVERDQVDPQSSGRIR